ncbi:hypothetical protein ABK040_002002 [Willaertia magna]
MTTYFSSVPPSEIIEGKLYLGSFASARNLKQLIGLNVGGIVNCTMEIPNYYKDKMKYLKLNEHDETQSEMSKHFDKTFNFIEEIINVDNKAVLVHCAAGISRSSTIVIHYLMKKYHLTAKDAIAYVKTKRKIIMPNNGYFSQLLDIEKTYLGTSSLQMEDYFDLHLILPKLTEIPTTSLVTNQLEEASLVTSVDTSSSTTSSSSTNTTNNNNQLEEDENKNELG